MPEDIKQDVVLRTQRYLGKYVKKPPLTDKLLRKPPFRFLHDVVNAVVKETGFLKGLFNEDELNSENVKERDAKVAFLTKLIDAVKVITNTDLAVRPSKIVAGLEPTETNLLLQTIGKAIDKKLDSGEYVNNINSGQNTKKPKKSEKNERIKRESKEKTKSTPRNHEKPVHSETPKSTDREKGKKREAKTKSDRSKEQHKEKPKKKEPVIEPAKEEVPEPVIIDNQEKPQQNDVETDSPPQDVPTETEPKKRTSSASRPKSARPKSGDRKEEHKEPVLMQSRPMSSLRPPSVRPSSARPGAPRLRPDSAIAVKEIIPMGKINVIVENFDKDADEEETVVIQSNAEAVEENESVADVPKDKGHLVEQILEQISESDANSLKVEEKQRDGKETTTKETNNLRSLIQALTKTANPLGKLLNYLHEDIDAMQAELETWAVAKKQLFEEIAKQRRVSTELNKPLYAQLDHLTHEIKKMEEEIVSARSNILRNETRIKELLSK